MALPTRPSFPCFPYLPSSRQCNTLNFHIHPLRQLLHRHATPRRLPHEPILVLAVQLREICHVRQEHIHLDHLLERGVGGGENRFDVGAAGGGFLGDGAGDEVAGWGGGDLARNVDYRGRFDGLRLWDGGDLSGPVRKRVEVGDPSRMM